MSRVMVIKIDETEISIFDEIMEVLKRHPTFEHLRLNSETCISLSGLEIYPERRKAYCNHNELNLTHKEFDLLWLLVANRGHVLSYGQIYQQVWGGDIFGNERNSVSCHVRNLRKKIGSASPKAPIVIRCIREIGYCFEI